MYMEFRKMVMITLYGRQQKRHRCIEQSFSCYFLSEKKNHTNESIPLVFNIKQHYKIKGNFQKLKIIPYPKLLSLFLFFPCGGFHTYKSLYH